MYYDENPGALNFVAGLILGAAVGAGVALLMAPDSGRKTRRRLSRAATDARDAAGERWEDLAHEVRSAMDAGRRRLKI